MTVFVIPLLFEVTSRKLWGPLMGRLEQGTGHAFSLFLSLLPVDIRDKGRGHNQDRKAISLTLSTVISTAPASGAVLRALPPPSNDLSRGINCKRAKR